jgi:DNA-binding Xre family transcriptional regulator
MIAGKVLLFSESAMIRAPYSLIVVRPHQVLVTPDVADFALEGTCRNLDAQPKSTQCREMNAIQCKLARVALNWGVRDLAEAASVSTQTITRLESGERLRASTLERIKHVLEDAGIEFIPENGGGVGVRFRDPT